MNIQRWISALLGFPMLAAVLILGNKFVIDIVFDQNNIEQFLKESREVNVQKK